MLYNKLSSKQHFRILEFFYTSFKNDVRKNTETISLNPKKPLQSNDTIIAVFAINFPNDQRTQFSPN